MKLVGTKEFLKIAKPGMFFLQFWTSTWYCYEIINKYENNQFNEILDDYNLELYVYGDNSGSLYVGENDLENQIFDINGKNYNCLCYTDLNIIGDACPYSTLYLLFDDVDEIFDCAIPGTLTKEDLRIVRDWFLDYGSPFTDEVNDPDAWALKTLEEDYSEDKIVNYKYNYKESCKND